MAELFGSNDLFYLERLGLKFLGLDLLKSKNLMYKIYSMGLIFGCLSIYTLLFFDLLKKDLNNDLDSWLTFITYFGILILVATTNYNCTKINNYFSKLSRAPFIPEDNVASNVKLKLLQKWYKLKNIQMLVFVLIVLVAVSSQIIYCSILRLTKSNPQDWKLIYGTVYIIDTTKSPNFELVSLFMFITVMYNAGYAVMFTVVVSGVFNFIATQFKVLHSELEGMVANAERNQKSEVNKNMRDCLNNEVNNIVSYHQQIIYVIKEMETIFSLPILYIFSLTLVLSCLEIYRTYLVPAGDIRTMRALLEGLSVCLPTLLICNAAENMATESAKLALAASTIDFVGSDLGFQKYLVMIIRQAQKSPRIKAGKCIDVSLLSFTKILRSSYSIYTVLRSFNENKK